MCWLLILRLRKEERQTEMPIHAAVALCVFSLRDIDAIRIDDKIYCTSLRLCVTAD